MKIKIIPSCWNCFHLFKNEQDENICNDLNKVMGKGDRVNYPENNICELLKTKPCHWTISIIPNKKEYYRLLGDFFKFKSRLEIKKKTSYGLDNFL